MTCTYWQRQEHRDADENGFGCSPWSLMSPTQAEEHGMARELEDESDPPCGSCVVCAESARSALDVPPLSLSQLMLARPRAGLAFEDLARARGWSSSDWEFVPCADIDGVVYAVGPGSAMPRYAWVQGITGHADEWMDLRATP